MTGVAAEVERGLREIGGFDITVDRRAEVAVFTLRLPDRAEHGRIFINNDGVCFSLCNDLAEFELGLAEADEVESLPAAAVKCAADWKAGRVRLETRRRMWGLCEETLAWWDDRPCGRRRRWLLHSG